MSACKTGCGAEAPTGSHVCAGCYDLWLNSPEAHRCVALDVTDPRGDVAFVDFCTRVRTERQTGVAE